MTRENPADSVEYPPVLRSRTRQSESSTRPTSMSDHETSAVPPPDEGYAWIFLAAGFVIETLAFGFTFSIGVFHEYWTSVLFPEPAAVSTITLAVTLCSGLSYISCAVLGPIFTRYPEYRAVMQYAGLVTSVAGITGCAFATQPWHLILSAGFAYPVGACTYYLPAVTLLFQWFQRKRGLATGIMFAGTGFGGAGFPFIMQTLLDRFSYKAAVVSLALSYGLFGAVAVFFVQERLPVPKRNVQSADPVARRRIPLAFFRRNTFYAFNVAILLTSLGNFLPSIYLPSFAADSGLSTTKGTLLVAVMNTSSIIGLLVLGDLGDRWPLRTVLTISCMGGSLSCFLLWGFATSLSALLAFSILFGFFGLGFTVLTQKLVTIVSEDDPAMPPIIFSLFAFTKGIGNILSGPISDALLNGGRIRGVRYGYGVENYGGLLLWTGGVIALGSIAGVCYKEKKH